MSGSMINFIVEALNVTPDEEVVSVIVVLEYGASLILDTGSLAVFSIEAVYTMT